MAKRQLTDQSSPQERAIAADELRRAQQQFQSWLESARNDPTREREIFEGVDYGPLISANDIEQQKRQIAAQYDYVDFGDFDSTSLVDGKQTIGTGELFIPNVGSNPDVISNDVNNTSFIPTDDYYTPPLPTTTLRGPNQSGARDTALNNTTSSYQNSFSRLGEFDTTQTSQEQTGSLTGGTDVNRYTPEGYSNDPFGEFGPPTKTTTNTDDSGAVDGTGIGAGTPSTGAGVNTGNSGTGTSDPDRFDATGEDVGPDVSQPGGAGADNTGVVDVTSLATPREGENGSVYEVNLEDLEIRPNILHQYSNWTYGISLYMLKPGDYQTILDNGNVTNPETELSNLLIRSGGTGGKGALGEKKDYYIENLRFTSIVGQNSRGARSSNNFDISFDVIEPYGVAFLSELVQLASLNGIEDHHETPYLLEIKFVGYNTKGEPVPNIVKPKYIPIKIVTLDFSISSANTTYKITAVPYSHSPLQDQKDAFIKEAISLEGQTFDELMSNLFEYINRSEDGRAQRNSRDVDVYSYKIFDEDLKSSKVGFTHKTQGEVVSVERQSMSGNTNEKVQINAGSTIKSAIQAIVNATDFGARFNTTGQPESEQGNETKPYRLIKIIPVVTKIKSYNTSTMRYAKDITFKIETQKMYGFKAPGMPAAPANQRGWLKEYYWIFTGKNQDIIDFNAEYNLQYFNITNDFVNQKGRVTGAISNDAAPLANNNLTRTQAGGGTYQPSIRNVSNPETSQIYNSYRGPGHQLASDHMDNILNNPGADMLAIDLKIIGDPEWIPQDKSVLPQGETTSGDQRLVNESLAVDTFDQFVMLRFKTPRDYDPQKGLMQIDTEQTFVQGLYRVITLESNFYDGKFEQNLSLVRIQDQTSNDSANLPNITTGAESANGADPARGDNLTSRLDTKGETPTNNNVTVTDAVSNLEQRPGETAEEFLDRAREVAGDENLQPADIGEFFDDPVETPEQRSLRTREQSLRTDYSNPGLTRAQPFTGPQ